MANLAVTNAEILVGGLDMSSFLNQTTLKLTAKELIGTTFGQTSEVRIVGGLKDTDLSWLGFWTSVPDAAQFSALGTANQAVTVSPEGAEGKVAYLFQGGQFSYKPFGKLGELAPFAAGLKGTDGKTGCVRGQLASLNRTVSGTGQLGSILTLAGPSATQFVYCTVHVLTAATTVTLQLQSATLIGFGSPTTQATIGPLTTTGGTFMTRVPGAITDGFWRLNVSAITGSFVISAAIGVQ